MRTGSGYAALKLWMIDSARADIRRLLPEYVDAYQRTYTQSEDLETAGASAEAVRSAALPVWPELLTRLFDLEHVRFKMVDAHELMKRAVASREPSAGFYISYHLDHWTFQSGAYLDRLERLVKRSVRLLIRPHNASWQAIENQVMHAVTAMKKELGKVRNPLAHGLGDGVSALVDRWEPLLAHDEDVINDEEFVRQSRRQLHDAAMDEPRRNLWMESVERSSVTILAYSERVCDDLLPVLMRARA